MSMRIPRQSGASRPGSSRTVHLGAPIFIKLPAAARAAQRVDRNAGRAERFHVAVNGTPRYLESLRHLATSHPPPRLEKQQGGEKSISFHVISWKQSVGVIMTSIAAGHVVAEDPRHQVISDTLTHWAHHRGQLSVYLRIKNVPLASIYGPTADERPF